MVLPQFLQILFAVLIDTEAEARADDMRDLVLAAECRKLYMQSEEASVIGNSIET